MKFRTDLINYLSEKSGLPVYDEISITLEERDNRKDRPSIWVKVDNEELQVSYGMIKGGIKVLQVRICKFDSKYCGHEFSLDYNFDKMYYKKYRTVENFKIPYTVKPNAYRNCEGGGWHSMVDVVVVDGLEFANV